MQPSSNFLNNNHDPFRFLAAHYQDGASSSSASAADYFNTPYEHQQFTASSLGGGYPMYYSTKAIDAFQPQSSTNSYLFENTDFTYTAAAQHSSPASLSSSLGSSPHLSDVFLSDASSSPDPIASPLRQFDPQPNNVNGGLSYPHIPYRNVPPPVPVPHLIKRSRGRQVPTISSQSPFDALDRSFVCTVHGCGKGFQRAEHLKRHIRSIHTNDKPHTCPEPSCGRKFSRRDNLCQHFRVHLRESGQQIPP